MSIKNFAAAAVASTVVLASTAVQAANYTFDYTALSSSQFQAASGNFGASVIVGDTVTFNLTASAGNQFQAVSSDSMWAILGFDSGASRYSSYTYNFYSNNAVVGGGSTFETTCCIHMGPTVSVGFNGTFDKYSWTGTLLSDDGNGNIASDIGYNSPALPNYGGQWSYGETSAQFVAAPVPEPETYALMLAGLGLVGFMARRRKAQIQFA